MCGIFTLLNTDNTDSSYQIVIKEQFDKGKRRGPENSKLEYSYLNLVSITLPGFKIGSRLSQGLYSVVLVKSPLRSNSKGFSPKI